MRHPYAFRVLGGTELRAAEVLERFNVEPRTPYEYKCVRKSDGGVAAMKQKAVMPGYFVGMFDPREIWLARNARYPNGGKVLGRPLSADGEMRPLSLDDFRKMDALTSYCEQAPYIPKQRNLKPGDYIVITDGIHEGKRFRLQAVKNSELVQVAMDMLGSLRDVWIDTRRVELVDAA